MKIGQVVALTRCVAWWLNPDGPNEATHISGLATIEEWIPYEPSNYQHECGYTVSQGEQWYYISADTLCEQVDPRAWASILLNERMMDFAE